MKREGWIKREDFSTHKNAFLFQYTTNKEASSVEIDAFLLLNCDFSEAEKQLKKRLVTFKKELED